MRVEDVYAFVLLEHEQVFVAGDDAIAFSVFSDAGAPSVGLC